MFGLFFLSSILLLQKLVHFMPANIFNRDGEVSCNLKCPFFLHIDFPMVLNDQKLGYFIKNEIYNIMIHSWKKIYILYILYIYICIYIYICTRGWGSLSMAFTGKFVYIYCVDTSLSIIQFSSYPLLIITGYNTLHMI